MSTFCEDIQGLAFTDMPLHCVFSEWLKQNFHISTNTSSLIAHIALFFLTWYMVKFSFQIILSIMWPLKVLAVIMVIFHLSHEWNIGCSLCEQLRDIYYWMVQSSSNIIGLFFTLHTKTSQSL